MHTHTRDPSPSPGAGTDPSFQTAAKLRCGFCHVLVTPHASSHSVLTPALSGGCFHRHHLWMGKLRLTELGNLLKAAQLAAPEPGSEPRTGVDSPQPYLSPEHSASLSSPLLLPLRQVAPHTSGRSCGFLVCISQYVCWVFKFRHRQHHHLWGVRGALADPLPHWHIQRTK